MTPLLSEGECRDLVTQTDWQQAQSFASVTRRAEYLSWRVLLYRHLGCRVDIEYLPNGQPHIVGSDMHIGVSHTKDCVAVVISEHACAVDVEHISRNMDMVRDRYFTEYEQRLVVDNNCAAVAIWCARECYYKLCGEPTLSLLTDISVVGLDIEAGWIKVARNGIERATFQVAQYGQYMVVYLI